MKKSKPLQTQKNNLTPKPDLSFGKEGTVSIPFPVDPELLLSISLVATDPNKHSNQLIYVSCWRTVFPNAYRYLVRLLEDGEIDRSFGENGYSLLPYGGPHELIFFRDSGAITGFTWSMLLDQSWWVPAAERVTSSGQLDTGFAGYGYRHYPPPWILKSAKPTANAGKTDIKDTPWLDQSAFGEANHATHFNIQPDGKILFLASYRQFPNGYGVASYLARINLDGSPDNTFGQNGFVKIEDPAEPETLLYCRVYDVDRSGGAVVTTERRNTAILLRYDAQGELDRNFGNGGVVTIPFSTPGGRTIAIKALDDGAVIIVFEINGVEDGGSYLYFYPAVTKLLINGSRDPSFNNGALLEFDDIAPNARLRPDSMALDAANRILIAGVVDDGPMDQSGFLARILPNGTRDIEFGIKGLAIREDARQLISVAIQNGTKILSAVGGLSARSIVRFIT